MITVTLSLADGETREARMSPDSSYSCPFCSGAVLSAESWQDNEANTERAYTESREPGDQVEPYKVKPYPRWMGEVWEARGCGNPACLINMSAATLASAKARIAEREAETARQARIHESIMAGIRESREREAALWAEISTRAREAGQCVSCLRASYWQSRPKLVRHRETANCPQARRYQH